MKSISWRQFFQIETDPMVTLQVIPDRSVRNWRCDDLARALYDLQVPPLKRFTWGRWWLRYRPQEYFSFDITLEAKAVRFWLTVPARWQGYAQQQLNVIWPKATIRPGAVPASRPAACADLALREHSFYSLATAKNDNRPLNSLLEITRDLQPGDLARVQLLAMPFDRQVWEHDATQAYAAHRQGRNLRRQEYTLGAIARYLMEFADALCGELSSTVGEFFGIEPQTAATRDRQLHNTDLFALRHKRGLSEATMHKISEPVFATSIRLAVQSDDPNRAKIVTRNLATACNDLAGDNELARREIPDRGQPGFAKLMNESRLLRVRISYSVLSASELGKFMQVPGPELQDQFPAVEQIPLRETNLPTAVTSGGLRIGTVRNRGVETPVYLPVSNHDELCLPHIVIGGMGTGKTMGFGANLAVEAVRAGMGAVVIDPAKGELGDEVEAILPAEKVIRIRFGRVPVALDWKEVTHSERARNRLANELIAFCEAASEEAGAQTIRYMRAAAKAVPGGRLSEVVALLTDQKYRKSLLTGMRPQERETWTAFEQLSDARQAQIGMPVLNRLDVIMGDDYLADCMDAPTGLDFVELLREPKIIVLDIPKSELGAEAVDVLASMVATKLDLAMTLRKSKHPVFVIQDEPHQYCRSARIWRSAAVESRKWRFCYCWMFHAWEQIPRDVASIIQAAGPHYHLYTSSKATYRALAEEIKPFDIEEAMSTPRHWAINVIRAGGVTVTPFLAKMALPPSRSRTTRGYV